MIPKIIHYCWLSDDEYPESIKKCLDSWKKLLPDYEIRLWDRNRFDINSTLWTKQAFWKKKYAFAADYIRLYALYTEGGIYLDSDVLVYKSFNDLLHLPYFIGEDYVHCFEPAIIGCEPGLPWIKKVLDRYDGLSFINEDGSYNMTTLPVVFINQLRDEYRFNKVKGLGNYNLEEGCINIFSFDYFNSRDHIGSKQFTNSYCTHHYAGSWEKKQKKAKSILKRVTPRCLANIFYMFETEYIFAKHLKKKQIPYD